jgi:Arc/MetJ-type ribon-helix-helix transcriptional regulator
MTIDLPPQIGRIVRDGVLSGQYRTAEEVVIEAVSCGQERQRAEPASVEKQRQEAIERLQTFGKRHGLSFGGMTIGELRDEARP